MTETWKFQIAALDDSDEIRIIEEVTNLSPEIASERFVQAVQERGREPSTNEQVRHLAFGRHGDPPVNYRIYAGDAEVIPTRGWRGGIVCDRILMRLTKSIESGNQWFSDGELVRIVELSHSGFTVELLTPAGCIHTRDIVTREDLTEPENAMDCRGVIMFSTAKASWSLRELVPVVVNEET